jgi:membrane-bound lytic murein transglycosylase A
MRKALLLFAFIFAAGCSKDESLPPEKLKDSIDICGQTKMSLADEPEDRPLNIMQEVLREFETPTKLVSDDNLPYFEDDLSFSGLDQAIDRQLTFFKARPPSGTIKLGGKVFPLNRVVKSLQKMRALIGVYKDCKVKKASESTCLKNFNLDIRKYFYVVQPELAPEDPRYGEDKQTLFTGYYTPLLRGFAEPQGDFVHAVYLRPQDKYVPTPRVDIDFRGQLQNKNLELIYINELFLSYLLHVQGSGKAQINTPSGVQEFYIGYNGNNGLTWRFISQYMLQKGYIKNGSIAAQREFLAKNPERQEEIFATCPSYIYFLRSPIPPKGSGNVSVTPNRTIATDNRYYRFKGMLAYVVARRPTENTDQYYQCKQVDFKKFSRFFLDQDTGGAIRGKARVDIYFGEDDYAAVAAYNTVERGDLYFLMLR